MFLADRSTIIKTIIRKYFECKLANCWEIIIWPKTQCKTMSYRWHSSFSKNCEGQNNILILAFIEITIIGEKEMYNIYLLCKLFLEPLKVGKAKFYPVCHNGNSHMYYQNTNLQQHGIVLVWWLKFLSLAKNKICHACSYVSLT